EKDIQPVFDIHTDPDVMRYYGVKPYASLDKSKEHLDWLAKLHREEIGLRWIITLKERDQYIGDVGFYDWEKKHRRAEIGYILGKQYWGKGIMTEAIKAALDYGFNEMNLNRIQALIDPRNDASKKVAEKHGFKYEGTFRDYEYEYGDFIDLNMYSVLKREYRA
ncbi:MAG: GNAT family N-acetyltransferase, partial [Candidatus Bathyarchaeota archaeon]|nr:GNAT family N-acetyltransferase [Candidatus Bathyarchaeota archaeon]